MASKELTPLERIKHKYLQANYKFEGRYDISIIKALVVYLLCGLFLCVFFVPLVWMMSSTFMEAGALFSTEYIFFAPPDQLTLQNYIDVIQIPEFRRFLLNSIVISLGTTALSLGLGIPAAYSLSHFEYPGQDPMLLFYLTVRMLPPVLFLIPFYALMFELGLVDQYLGLILAHAVIALPLVIWLMKGYFDDIPDSLSRAGLIDGCNHFDVMVRIMIPLSKPGIAVAGFWAFTTSWGDFLFASIISQSQSTRPVSVGLHLFMGQYSVEWNLLLAAAMVMMVPVVILFLAIQGWIVEGIKGTGGGGTT